MARSYPSTRYPGGPYIEPQVNPALRGPKRTGPIGELVPGDDVEVARILARLGRRPRHEPIVYEIKLFGDDEDEKLDKWNEVRVFEDDDLPHYVLTVRHDMALLNLIRVQLSVTTASTDGPINMNVVNLTRSEDEGEPKYLVDPAYFPIIILEDEYDQIDDEEEDSYTINLDNNELQFRDRIGFYLEEVGTDVLGMQLGLWFQ